MATLNEVFAELCLCSESELNEFLLENNAADLESLGTILVEKSVTMAAKKRAKELSKMSTIQRMRARAMDTARSAGKKFNKMGKLGKAAVVTAGVGAAGGVAYKLSQRRKAKIVSNKST